MILGWTVLQPSARERRLWLMAAVAAAAVAVLLATVMWSAEPRHPGRLGVAAVASACAAAWAVRSVRRKPDRHTEVAVGHDGMLHMRRAGTTEPDRPDAAHCVFVAPWLITLRCGAILVAIWPDSLPSDAFRRLHACARWAGTAQAGAHNNNRTGSQDDFPH
ncbi:MAG TPA: hypothetical protein PKV98_12475 [Burkholderiaceae bacterium]|nr:hypothetical protein [Burkholderiaceae bacterium]